MAEQFSYGRDLDIPPIEDVEKAVRIIRANTYDKQHMHAMFKTSSDFGKNPIIVTITLPARALFMVASLAVGSMYELQGFGPQRTIEREQSAMPEYLRKDTTEFALKFEVRNQR